MSIEQDIQKIQDVMNSKTPLLNSGILNCFKGINELANRDTILVLSTDKSSIVSIYPNINLVYKPEYSDFVFFETIPYTTKYNPSNGLIEIKSKLKGGLEDEIFVESVYKKWIGTIFKVV